MATLPVIEQRTRVSGVGDGPGPMDQSGLLALGQAFKSVANDVAAVKVNDIENSWQLADTTAKTLGALNEYATSLQADEDYDSHGAKFVAKAQEIEKETRGTIKSPLMYKIWQEDFRRAAAHAELGVAVTAQKLKTDRVRSDLTDTLQSLSGLVGVNETQDAIVHAQARLAVERNAASGNLTYAEKSGLLRKFDSDAAETSIRRDMLANPEIAEAKLATRAYPGLTGEAEAIWAQRASTASEAASRRRLADEEHAQRIGEHAVKIAGDQAAKELDQLGPGNLTASAIEQRRDVLSESDYRYFYRELRNPSGSESAPGNVPLYANLRERAGRGEDVRDEARVALTKGAIRSSDYDRIVGEVESERPGWRTLGASYLSTVSGYSELNPTPGAAQLKAAMLDEWSQWADGHKNATSDEARKMYQAIGDSHQLADSAVKQLTLPWPTYGVGDRAAIDLAATAQRAKAALDAGEITPEEYVRQGAIWKQWNDLYKGQPPK